MICSIPECIKPLKVSNLCGMHYQRIRRNGTVEPKETEKTRLLRNGFCRCSRCKRVKGLHLFNRDKNTIHGIAAYCRSCSQKRQNTDRQLRGTKNKEYYLRSKYKMPIEEWDRLFKEQAGLCKICQKKKHLYVDHCHKTSKIRGLLCNQCNFGLGYFFDSPELLMKASQYLVQKNYLKKEAKEGQDQGSKPIQGNGDSGPGPSKRQE